MIVSFQNQIGGLHYLFPYIARDILQAIHFIHKIGYVHKDIHLDNVFVHLEEDKIFNNSSTIWKFKIGDVGISNLETNINVFNTILAQWMSPPESLNCEEFGYISKQTDIYHTGLLLLSVLLGYTPRFTDQQIKDGVPRQTAENHPSPYGQAIAKALRRHVKDRTQTALEFWHDIKAA